LCLQQFIDSVASLPKNHKLISYYLGSQAMTQKLKICTLAVPVKSFAACIAGETCGGQGTPATDAQSTTSDGSSGSIEDNDTVCQNTLGNNGQVAQSQVQQ
jgi:hypothetical protein